MEGYQTIGRVATAEWEVKRSRFIATAFPCETEQDAADRIAEIRKKHWNARHNVYAFSLREGGLRRYSDDGEPHSTAGLPVLQTILHAGLDNVAVVVTRYFGGVLLGTGGLVRAYSEAARLALQAAGTVTVLPAVQAQIVCDYSDYDSLEKLIGGFRAKVLDTAFESQVCITVGVAAGEWDAFVQKTDDSFCGRLQIAKQMDKFLGFC